MSLMMYYITCDRKHVSNTFKVSDTYPLSIFLNFPKIQYRAFFFFFFLFLSKTLVFAQETPSKPFATLDSNVVLIGDKVVLNVGVIYDGSTRVVNVLPDLPLDTSKFGIIDLGHWGPEKNRLPNYSRTVIFQAFDTGLYRIPSVTFVLEGANGMKTTAITPSLLLTVNNPDGIDAVVSPVDIKPIVATEWTFQEDLLPFLKLYGPYFILAIALLFLAWRVWKQWKTRQIAPIIQQITQPPHIIAARLLAELRAKKLWENGKIKEFYSELSRILRGYIEDQFNIPALETTTEELIGMMKKRDFTAEIIEKAEDLLQTADLVKFAKVEPSTPMHENFLMDAENIVEITKPKPIEIETIKQ